MEHVLEPSCFPGSHSGCMSTLSMVISLQHRLYPLHMCRLLQGSHFYTSRASTWTVIKNIDYALVLPEAGCCLLHDIIIQESLSWYVMYARCVQIHVVQSVARKLKKYFIKKEQTKCIKLSNSVHSWHFIFNIELYIHRAIYLSILKVTRKCKYSTVFS